MALLSVDHLAVGYSGSLAVFDVSLDAEPGEIVALLGPNGAGKTTTLLTLAGYLRPTNGRIHFDGVDVSKHPPHVLARRGLGFIADDRGLISGLTVAENIALVRQKVIDPYELFPELKRLAGIRAGLLSGGEQQMLAIARVLASRPRLLLIDELSLGLGPMVVTRLLGALREAVDTYGASVLLVEQQVDQALAASDRAYVMVHGRIEVSATAAELRDNPEVVEASYMGGLVTSIESAQARA